MELLIYVVVGFVLLPWFQKAPLWLSWPYLLVFPIHAPVAIVMKCMWEPIGPYMNEKTSFF